MTRTTRFAVAFLVLLLIAAAWWPASQATAVKHSEAGLARALAMYAVARGLNAVISVAQGTQIAVEPAGVGAVIAVGQVLDPINDLVEQFAGLMLMAAVAFGLQTLLIKIGAHDAVSLLLTLTALTWFGLWWWRGQTPNWLARVLLVLMLARFAVPVCALASDAVYRGVMAGEYGKSEEVIKGTETSRRASESAKTDVTGTVQAPEEAKWSWPPSWLDFKKVARDVKEATANVTAIAADMKSNAQNIAEHMVRITVVFLLQTLVLPLLFLWLLIAVFRNAVSVGAASGLVSNQRQR